MTGLEDGTSKLPVITLYFLSNYFPVGRLGRRKYSVSVARHSFQHSNNYTNIYIYILTYKHANYYNITLHFVVL